MTAEKLSEIKSRYCFFSEQEIIEAFNFVQEILEAEADQVKKEFHFATRTIDRLEDAAYSVVEMCQEVLEINQEIM